MRWFFAIAPLVALGCQGGASDPPLGTETARLVETHSPNVSGPPDDATLVARLLDASRRGELPAALGEPEARELVAAMRRVGEAKRALREGRIERAEAERERAEADALCREKAARACDDVFFTPRRSP